VKRSLSVLVTALLTVSAAICAEEKPVGFLCCNMRTDGSWISDINYDENGKHLIAVGTPVKVTGYGRYRVKIEIDGKKQEIGNDYSRDLSLDEFAKRYVVAENPAGKISTFPKKVQDAIASARLTKGMTREQVLMSVGYPISSENHSLDAKVWHFWLSSFQEFRAKFDDNNLLSEVEADADTRSKVWLE
jgi:hypothetical protein